MVVMARLLPASDRSLDMGFLHGAHELDNGRACIRDRNAFRLLVNGNLSRPLQVNFQEVTVRHPATRSKLRHSRLQPEARAFAR